jgi:hypothetical protein
MRRLGLSSRVRFGAAKASFAAPDRQSRLYRVGCLTIRIQRCSTVRSWCAWVSQWGPRLSLSA